MTATTSSLKVLIPAAGLGTRSGLSYPKTLYKVEGVPILHRLLTLFSLYDSQPTVVVSPQGTTAIRDSLKHFTPRPLLVCQPNPLGMGDAVLTFAKSPVFSTTDHVLLAWGDLAYLQPRTVESLVQRYFEDKSDFAFSSRYVRNPYTYVQRSPHGSVQAVVESRESNLRVRSGERDIGLFVFRKEPVFSLLREAISIRGPHYPKEHGFLSVVEAMVSSGYRVHAYQNATALDCISLNSLSDLPAA